MVSISSVNAGKYMNVDEAELCDKYRHPSTSKFHIKKIVAIKGEKLNMLSQLLGKEFHWKEEWAYLQEVKSANTWLLM